MTFKLGVFIVSISADPLYTVKKAVQLIDCV